MEERDAKGSTQHQLSEAGERQHPAPRQVRNSKREEISDGS
jgi:hypothetical protein